jgi:hypothetical protein
MAYVVYSGGSEQFRSDGVSITNLRSIDKIDAQSGTGIACKTQK